MNHSRLRIWRMKPRISDGVSRRRGVALIITVLILAMVNLMVLSSVAGTGDDSRLAASRTGTVRAFFAAESGIAMVAGEYTAGRSIPSGTLTLPSGEQVDISASGSTLPITVTIVGRSGLAQRRLDITLQ